VKRGGSNLMDECVLRMPAREIGVVSFFFVLFSLMVLCSFLELIRGSFVMVSRTLVVLISL
jgi:hypothetical protein